MPLSDIIPLIQKVTEGQNLTVEEAEKAFTILQGEDLEGYFFFTFLAALHTKGETGDELLGFCKANEKFVPSFDIGVEPDKIIDLSGTGGDKVKTPNVSTAASFIVASRDIAVAKQVFFAVTGKLGSADLMLSFGIDPLALSREGPAKLKNIFQKTGLIVYHALSMANPEETKGLLNWANKRGEIGLSYVTAYHLAANAFSAIPMKRRIYGVFNEKYLKPLAEMFQKLGYNKGLVFNGKDGLDEISNVGETKIIEFSKSELKEYTTSPDDFGINTAQINEINIKNRETGICDFLKIIYGKEKGPKRDLVCINAAVAFYVMGEVSNFKEGTKLATSLIDNGKAASKLEDYVECCGDMDKLNRWRKKASI